MEDYGPEFAGGRHDSYHLQVVFHCTDRQRAMEIQSRCRQWPDVVCCRLQEEKTGWHLFLDARAESMIDLLLRRCERQLGDGVELASSRLVPVAGRHRQQADILARYQLSCTCGSAFGSGHHPSTRIAAGLLESLAAEQQAFPGRCLDVGCGTGILAMLCSRLGGQRVLGLDIDQQSLALARINVRENGLAHRVTISDAPLATVVGPFDLIVANLAASVLLANLSTFPALLAGGGRLVLAGYQQGQRQHLGSRLAEQGLFIMREVEQRGWCGLLARERSRAGR